MPIMTTQKGRKIQRRWRRWDKGAHVEWKHTFYLESHIGLEKRRNIGHRLLMSLVVPEDLPSKKRPQGEELAHTATYCYSSV